MSERRSPPAGDPPASVLRQGRNFALVGFAQWLADWAAMVALSHAGVALATANLAGRVAGALLGFWLNGRITFSGEGGGTGWRAFVRYVVLWCATAVSSTAAVTALNAAFGLRGAWLGKPLVDGALALGSFFASRQWVYR